MRPEVGRAFSPGDELPANAKVAIISHELWRTRFDSAADIIGRSIRIGGEPHDIIGVLPESANDGRVLRQVGVLLPRRFTPAESASRSEPWARVIGRCAAGVSVNQGKAFVAALGARLSLEHAKEDGDATWRAEGLLGSTSNRGGRIVVAMLLGLSACVLLIACSNLANFVLARTLERSQELSVRSALGATLMHLMRPLAIESLLLAAAGGAGAILVDLWSSSWLNAQSLASGGSPMQFPLDWRVLGFAVASSVVTALFFGTAPALVIARMNVNDALKSGARGATAGGSHRRLRSLLVVGQFAMAITLLAGAGFLARGASEQIHRHYGWDSGNVALGAVDLPKGRYGDAGKILAFQSQLMGKLRGIPGVDSVALAYGFPYSGAMGSRTYFADGGVRPAKGQEPSASFDGISPDYFKVTGGRLVAGRSFTDADTATSAHVVIINEGMARALFPNENPVGHRLSRADTEKPEWSEVVGITSDVQPAGIYQRPEPFQVYHPLAQEPWQYSVFALRARPGASRAVLAATGAAVASVDPDLPVDKLMSADDRVASVAFDLGMLKKMLGVFALLGLALAVLGIYGVLARTVVLRTREIGIRMALGASLADVRLLVVRSGLRLAVGGGVVGLLGAFGVTRLLASMMPAIGGSPVAAVAGAMLTLAAAALVACYLPARAASRVDPVTAIRAE